MKKSLLSLGLLLSAASYAQTVVLTANAGADFATWSAVDADQDTYTWGIYNLMDADGQGTPLGSAIDAQGEVAISFSYGDPAQTTASALTPDNWLVSPAIDLSTFTGASLTFGAGSIEDAGSTWAAENYSVYAVSDVASLATATALFTEVLPDGGQMYSHTVDLSSLAGSATVYVAFRHHNCTDMYTLVLDDIVVSGTAGINDNVISASVYPNPANDVLNININEEIASVSVLSLDGKVVATSTTSSVNVADLNAGMYIYQVTTTAGNVATGNFAKK